MAKRKQPRKPKPTIAFARKPARPPDFVRPPSVSRKAKTRRDVQLETAEAYRIVRETPYGKIVIADLLLSCSMFHDIADNEPIAVGRAIGRQSIGVHITKMLGLRAEHFPDEAWRVAGTADEMMGL